MAVSPATTPSKPGEYVSVVAGWFVVMGHLSFVICVGSISLFEGLIVEQVVQIFTRLHHVEDFSLCAFVRNHPQGCLGSKHGNSQQRDRIENGRIAETGELVEREERAFAELGHVGNEG